MPSLPRVCPCQHWGLILTPSPPPPDELLFARSSRAWIVRRDDAIVAPADSATSSRNVTQVCGPRLVLGSWRGGVGCSKI